jgi:hypothetical protein
MGNRGTGSFLSSDPPDPTNKQTNNETLMVLKAGKFKIK